MDALISPRRRKFVTGLASASLLAACGDRRGVGQVEVGDVDRDDRIARRPSDALELGAELAVPPGDEDGALALAHAATPRRSAALAATSGRHHASLARYQSTVLAMPLSKVSAGSQPSSRLILEASIA